MSYKPGKPDTELEGLVRYAQAKPSHPRYKWLPTRLVETGVLQYSKGVAFSQLDFANESRKQQERVKGDYDWPMRPNDFLLSALQRLAQDRLQARLEQAGLQDAFASPDWEHLMDGAENLDSKSLIPAMAIKIHKLISQFTFKGPKPTVQQVEKALRTNLSDEFGMQVERVYREQNNLGKGSIQFQPYIGNSIPDDDVPRDGMRWIRNAKEFYSSLMGIKHWTEMERIAAGIETDNQFENTAVALLLLDRGIDLHDYNLNLRQASLAFHTDGLAKAFVYLGVEQPRPQYQ